MTSYYPPIAQSHFIDPWQNPNTNAHWRWTCDACGFTERFTVPRDATDEDIKHYCLVRHNELTQRRLKDEQIAICTRDDFKGKGHFGRD